MTEFQKQQKSAHELVIEFMNTAAAQKLPGEAMIIPLITALVATVVALQRFGSTIQISNVVDAIRLQHEAASRMPLPPELDNDIPKQTLH